VHEVLHVSVLCPILDKIRISRQLLIELFNVKLHRNPLSGYPVVTCKLTDNHVLQITGAFLQLLFAKATYKIHYNESQSHGDGCTADS
jgi:hypothetical protein